MRVGLYNRKRVSVELKPEKKSKEINKQYATPQFMQKVFHPSATRKVLVALFLLMSMIRFCCSHEKST